MRLPSRRGRPGGPVRTLSTVALLLGVLLTMSACFPTPSLIVVSPLIGVGAALFFLVVGIIRFSKAAYDMTWSDLGRMTRRASLATYRAVRGLPTLARRVGDAGFPAVLRVAGKGLRLGLIGLAAVAGIAVAVPLVYALALLLLIFVEIPLWIGFLVFLIVRRVAPPVARAMSAAVRALLGRPPTVTTEHPVAGDADVDAQYINFRIPELDEWLDTPLVVGRSYLGVVQVGRPREDNLATGDTAIPRDDIPAEGLLSDWVLWSTTVRLEPADDPRVAFDVAEAGPDSQWMARFSLLIPRSGESEPRDLLVTPVVDGAARIDGLVRVSGDVYREFTVELRAATPVEPPGDDDPDDDDLTDTVVSTELLVVPAGELAGKPGVSWQRPASTLQILFLQSMAQLQSVELGPDEAERWLPDIAGIESVIARVRDAADAVRSRYQWAMDGITAESLAGRLAGFEPAADWGRPSRPVAGAEEQWAEMARSPELARLAYEGYALRRAIFPDGSRLAEVLGLLQPGDRLDLTWQQNGGAWVSHVPWTLLYAAEPPLQGEPVDAMQFLGLRYRIGYRAYSMGVRSRTIASGATRAHLMYWGGRDEDETWAASREHAAALARWEPLLLPTAAPGKAELQRFLHDPAPAPVGLLYFYCRCTVGDGSDPVLRFGSTNDPDATLGLIDLGTRHLPDQPLVFANACDTVAGEPYTPNRLERLFFDRRCRAFIGTECKVPIRFAARFADVFFTFLYGAGVGPVAAGEALVQARRFFWTEYRSIGGLFYSYVNDYHVRIGAEPGAVPAAVRE